MEPPTKIQRRSVLGRLKRRDQQWEEELNKFEEVYEAELKRKDQQ